MPEEHPALEDRDWRRLVRAIADGDCVLLLGPDAAIAPGGDGVQTLTARFVEQLRIDGLVADELHQVAQAFARAHPDHYELIDAVERFYARYATQTTELHRNLATLPFTLCLQTTPDRLFYNALAETQGKLPGEAFFHRFDGTQLTAGPFDEPTVDRPLVFGLHGSAADGESVVLTEHDLLEFLVRLVRDKNALPALLLRRLASAKTCLFLGFGFHSWYQRLVLHVLRGVPAGRRWGSIAVEGARFFGQPERSQTATFYEDEHLINFPEVPLTAFVAELRRRFEAQAASPAAAAAVAGAGADAPMVFLCYDSRDEAAVTALAERLRVRGINAWRDHDNLRGGDNWQHVAEHVLTLQVDYVAVLHSTNLHGGESWARLEINLALERRKKFPKGFRFVIPCHFLGGTQRLKEFEDESLHYLSVPDAADIDALVDAIGDDWRRNDRLALKRGKPR